MSELGKTLLAKLTKEELTDLCEAWDDGTLDDVILDELCPKDALNYPEKYADPDSDIRRD